MISRADAAWSEEFIELVRRVCSSEVGANFEIDLAAGPLQRIESACTSVLFSHGRGRTV